MRPVKAANNTSHATHTTAPQSCSPPQPSLPPHGSALGSSGVATQRSPATNSSSPRSTQPPSNSASGKRVSSEDPDLLLSPPSQPVHSSPPLSGPSIVRGSPMAVSRAPPQQPPSPTLQGVWAGTGGGQGAQAPTGDARPPPPLAPLATSAHVDAAHVDAAHGVTPQVPPPPPPSQQQPRPGMTLNSKLRGGISANSNNTTSVRGAAQPSSPLRTSSRAEPQQPVLSSPLHARASASTAQAATDKLEDGGERDEEAATTSPNPYETDRTASSAAGRAPLLTNANTATKAGSRAKATLSPDGEVGTQEPMWGRDDSGVMTADTAEAEMRGSGESSDTRGRPVRVQNHSLSGVPTSSGTGSILRHSPLLTLSKSPAHAMLFSSVYQQMHPLEDASGHLLPGASQLTEDGSGMPTADPKSARAATTSSATPPTNAAAADAAATTSSDSTDTNSGGDERGNPLPTAAASRVNNSAPAPRAMHHHHHHHQSTQTAAATRDPQAMMTMAARVSGAPMPSAAAMAAATPPQVGQGRGGAVAGGPVPLRLPTPQGDVAGGAMRPEGSPTTTVAATGMRFHHHHHHHHGSAGGAHVSPYMAPRAGMPTASPPSAAAAAASAAFPQGPPSQGPPGGYGGQPSPYYHHHHHHGYYAGYGPTAAAVSPTMMNSPPHSDMATSPCGSAGVANSNNNNNGYAQQQGGFPSPPSSSSEQQPPQQPQSPYLQQPVRAPGGNTTSPHTSPQSLSALPATVSGGNPHYRSPASSYGHLSPAQNPMTSTPPLSGHPQPASPNTTGARRDGTSYNRVSGAPPLPMRYTSPPPPPPPPSAGHNGNNNASVNASMPQGGGVLSPAAFLLYDHQVNDELWVEDRKSELPFSPDVYGNVACLISAISPQIAVSHALEIPSECRPTFDNGTGLSGPVVRTHPSGSPGVDPNADAATEMSKSGESGAADSSSEEWDAVRHYRYYRQLQGPSFTEPVARLRDVWEGFDSPFGYTVNLAQPVQLAGMKPPEDQVVYEPLLSGFRIGFHDAAPAYHYLAAARGVETNRFHRHQARARAAMAKRAPASTTTSTSSCAASESYAEAFSAVDVGVLSWSAAERPDSRHVITRQVQELARANPLFEPLLTGTTADVDHRSWVAILWQPVFIGGHSSKHSCGSFLAYYMLRPPRHLFMPFAERNYGAAMNSAWNSPAFRADRAVINFDMWSFERTYDVGRPVLPPTDKTLLAKKKPRTSGGSASITVEEEEDQASRRSPVDGAAEAAGELGPSSAHANATTAVTTGLALPPPVATPSTTTASALRTSSHPSVEPLTPPSSVPTGLWERGAGDEEEEDDEDGGGVPGVGAPAQPTAPALAAPFICIPVVGLVPSRCRSEAWFVHTDYPLDPQQLPSRRMERTAANNNNNNSNNNSGSATMTAAGGATTTSASATTTPSVSGGHSAGGGSGGAVAVMSPSAATAAPSRPQDLVWPYRVPLFFLASALQLMSWNAFEEHLRLRRLERCCVKSEAAAPPLPLTDGPTTEAASSAATAAAAAATSSLSRRASALPPPLQADAVVRALENAEPQPSSAEPTTTSANGGDEQDKEVPYYRCGVQLMNQSAQMYRSVREAAKVDQAMDDASSTYARPGEGRKSTDTTITNSSSNSSVCPVAVAGGCSSGVRAVTTMVTRGDFSEALGTIVGLLDFYRWAQFDTSLQQFAETYCQT